MNDWIIHRGAFFKATPTKLRLVAAVWDRAEGGGIIAYADLGMHGTEKECESALQEAKLNRRGPLQPNGSSMSFTFGDSNVRPDLLINTYSTDTERFMPENMKLAYAEEGQ